MSVSRPGRVATPNATVRMVVTAIEMYRHMVSPLRPPSCRFMPTCSRYAVDALTEYGLLRGAWLTLRRLGRCGPWCAGGWDPIPERGSDEGSQPEVRSMNV
jgi:putative membrane protein insertion efficiency factor